MSDEFAILDVSYGTLLIAVRLRWIPLPDRGAVRARDGAVWEGARQCPRCRGLGYDHDDIDAVLEAQRLGVADAPHVGGCCP